MRAHLMPAAAGPHTMKRGTTRDIAKEACRVLDALAALSVDIACQQDAQAVQRLVPQGQAGECCSVLREAVEGLKQILAIAEASGGALLPRAVLSGRRASRNRAG